MSELNHRAFMEMVRNHPKLRYGKCVPARLVLPKRYSPNERNEVFNLEEATFEDVRLASNALSDQIVELTIQMVALRDLYEHAKSVAEDESFGIACAFEYEADGSLS